MGLKVDECGKLCPFFLCDNRLENKNCRCFLNPTLNTSMWSNPGKKSFPANCKLKKKGFINVQVRKMEFKNENKN